MINLIKKIHDSFLGLIWNFITVGLILLMLGVLIVIDESTLALRMAVGATMIALALSFFYAASKIWGVKKEIEKHL